MFRPVAIAICLLLALLAPAAPPLLIEVAPDAETDPVPSSGDAADDIAIWVHPTDPAKSLIIGTNKQHGSKGGLYVYDLAGKTVSACAVGTRMNNVDVRYGFTLAGKKVDIFAATNRSDEALDLFVIDPDLHTLTQVGRIDLDSSGLKGLHNPYGLCLHHDRANDAYHLFVSGRSGQVAQFELKARENKIVGDIVRHWEERGVVEGMVADDLHGFVYIGEESGGIYRYKAVPALDQRDASGKVAAAPADRVVVDTTKGHLTADVEGLAIYETRDGGGYLLASSQGNDRFVIYDRKTLAYIATFAIVATRDKSIDGVNDTDGIDVVSGRLSEAYPQGLFIAQDGSNDKGHQNFKLVSWSRIVAAAKEKGTTLAGEERTPMPRR